MDDRLLALNGARQRDRGSIRLRRRDLSTNSRSMQRPGVDAARRRTAGGDQRSSGANWRKGLAGINVFDPNTGLFLGTLTDSTGNPIVIGDLWALVTGNNGTGSNPNAVYFTLQPA